jgi:hypothetical protein
VELQLVEILKIIGYNAKFGNYATAIGSGAQATGMYGISIGTNCQNATDYSTSIGYSAQSALGATSLDYSAKASGTFSIAIEYNATTTSQGIAIGGQCNNTTANYIKFWIGNDSLSK